ncbi:thiopeptide-type bacteriocin biosynthesis protein [Aquimarina muelleri]|uniref:thiopeptide-type bacteriocin biosynthesis protein n=1 Tax=Aquimarina muelleri TaxID=279356 RepID=UPI003F6840C0
MSIKRTFILGDEWLYYKIYCGARTSDTILIEAIKPVVEQLLEKESIDSWFFIRYADPDFHIRIRLHLRDVKYIGDTIFKINAVLQKYVEQHIIFKIQTDTYIRELERYGRDTMVVSEELFFYDSSMLLDGMARIEDEELYFLFVVKAIDSLLNSFGYENKEKLDLVSQNSLAFKREFHADKALNKQLDKKYRGLKSKLSLFLERDYIQEDYSVLDQIIDYKAKRSRSAIQNIRDKYQKKELEMPLDDLLGGYIHMLVNRAFRSKQRFYELVCYDFLLRYQKTQVRYLASS